MSAAYAEQTAATGVVSEPAKPPGQVEALSDVGLIVAVVIILVGLGNIFAAYAVGRYLQKRRKRRDDAAQDKPDQAP